MDERSGRSAVKVVVRVRECQQVSPSFMVGADNRSITIRQQKTDLTDGKPKDEAELQQFTCDATLNNASQERTFDVIGKEAADAVIAGYNGTVMCYGQTGAGKSFTMIGSRADYQKRGVAARCIAHAFREAANRPADEFFFKFSCLEIYNDQMYDLLSTLPHDGPRAELSLTEIKGRVEIKGLLNPAVASEEECLQLLFEADANRAVAQHQLNVLSSRSHVLYMLSCEKRSKVSPGAVVTSKLTLVDLAGSERLKKSAGYGGDQAKQLAKEAMSINKSLSFLEQVVVALGKRTGHVPHRSSRLTAVLRESLGGNCKTLLVANVWPEARHMEETLSTLKFAARMQSVTNMAAINSSAEVTPQAALAACQQQLADLKRELAMHDQLAGRAHITYDAYTPAQRAELKDKCGRFLEGEDAVMEAQTLRQVKESFELMRDLYKEQAQLLRAATEAAREAAENRAPPRAQQSGGSSLAPQPVDNLGMNLETEVVEHAPVEVVMVGDGGEFGDNSSGIAVGIAPDDDRPSDPQWRTPAPAVAAAPPALAEAPFAQRSSASYGGSGPLPGQGAADAFFSDFKRGAGGEVHALLLENKKTLRERRSDLRRFGLEVNGAKKEIDSLQSQLKQLTGSKGDPTHHNGVKVIDDEEFQLLSKIKGAKTRYRTCFDQLTDERSTVEYISSAVEQCRQQLLTDFSAWMAHEHPEHAATSAALKVAAALGENSVPAALGGGMTSSAYGSTKLAGTGYNEVSMSRGSLGGGYGGYAPAPAKAMGGEVVDQDEQFEDLETQLALAQDPDSLPFFKASKLARARKTSGENVVRSKGPRAFQP